MKPHPAFADREIPENKQLGAFHLKALGVADVERDYEAVMESAADIKATFPHFTWPEGLTLDDNLLDLAWHQREFAAKRSFAWVIEDADGAYLGCAYVYPSIEGDTLAEVWWWWKTGTSPDKTAFRVDFLGWLSQPEWPELDYQPLN